MRSPVLSALVARAVVAVVSLSLVLQAAAETASQRAAARRKAATHAVAGHAHASAHAAGHATAHVVAGHRSSSERPVGRLVSSRGRGAVASGSALRRPGLVRRYVERFTASSFADNTAEGDVTAGEDPVVRAAAIQALGNMNGTALAIDPANGRILAMVNQKLALSSGAEPCSTIKVAVALAGLSEGLIKSDTPVNLGRNYSLDLTHALAKSVNLYFEVLGRAMGFERVKHYANEFGLGELAGYNIPGEQLGTYPDAELPLAQGGVGRMCSFGESISMTPLQLGALVSAIANGGTLYYLQHPTTPEAVSTFQPKVKRQLDIQSVIPEILPGMQGAVDFSNGTARSLRTNFEGFPVLGKTGTCSNNGTRYGWFASMGNAPNGKIVTVIFLEGGKDTFGPKAAELTGEFYRAMAERNYFGPGMQLPAVVPVADGGQTNRRTLTPPTVWSGILRGGHPSRTEPAAALFEVPSDYLVETRQGCRPRPSNTTAT